MLFKEIGIEVVIIDEVIQIEDNIFKSASMENVYDNQWLAFFGFRGYYFPVLTRESILSSLRTLPVLAVDTLTCLSCIDVTYLLHNLPMSSRDTPRPDPFQYT